MNEKLNIEKEEGGNECKEKENMFDLPVEKIGG